MRFVVTGCARSGTGYVAMLLRAAGIDCGHEGAFGPNQVLRDEDPTWFDLEGDSSWLAGPRLPLEDTIVGHQVRHPLAVIRSLVGMRLFADPIVHPEHAPYLEVVRRVAPAIFDESTEADAAALYWALWNLHCSQHAALTWRVEALTDPVTAAEVTEALGHARTPEGMARVISIVPTNYNSSTFAFMRRDDSLAWDDVRPALRRRVQDLAERFGY